jgi:hypothetical protein
MRLVANLVHGLLLSVSATAALAQEIRVPPVEVGGQLAALGAFGEGLHMRAMVGPRVTVNLSQRNALEVSADVMVPSFDRGRIDGSYFLQYKRMLRARSAINANNIFMTVGTGGYFFHRRIGERHQPRVDGSVVVFPARTHAKLSPTRMATFSVGLEHRLNERFAARLEGGGLALLDQNGYIGFRLLAGLAVPIGGYRARD